MQIQIHCAADLMNEKKVDLNISSTGSWIKSRVQAEVEYWLGAGLAGPACS